MAAHCGDCDGCCRVFEVKDIDKPFGVPCKHLGQTKFGQGCMIYEERPEPCKHYVCIWLDSQRRQGTDKMPEELRPNACKVVMGWPFGIDRETMFVYPYPDHPDAWRTNKHVVNYLKMILSRGAKIMVIDGKHRWAIKGDSCMIGTEEEFANLIN